MTFLLLSLLLSRPLVHASTNMEFYEGFSIKFEAKANHSLPSLQPE